jgi:hypothetical protein
LLFILDCYLLIEHGVIYELDMVIHKLSVVFYMLGMVTYAKHFEDSVDVDADWVNRT